MKNKKNKKIEIQTFSCGCKWTLDYQKKKIRWTGFCDEHKKMKAKELVKVFF